MGDTNETQMTGESVLRITNPKRKRMAKLGISSRHRFNNRLSFILTAATFVLLGLLSVMFGNVDREYSVPSPSSLSSSSQNDSHFGSTRWLEDVNDDDGVDDSNNNGDDYSNFSCRYIYDQVSEAEDLCNYAKTCNDGQGVWAPWVFCSSKMSIYTSFAVLSPVAILWMVTLFRLLGSTAEDFFSCSLEMFSLKLGLPPRFAGVTLLALGNGAADVSATISAIVGDEENGYKLSLGALTGAAMLVGGVVAGVVVLVAGGVKCRGALIRDVMALMITVIIAWVKLSDGVVTHANTTMFFGLYGFFVCLVLTADIYHRAVVLPRMRAIDAAIADAEQRGPGGTEELESNPGITTTVRGPPPNAFMQFVTSFSNYDNSNPSPIPMQHQQLGDALRPPDMLSSASQSQTELVAPTMASSAIGEGAPGTAEFVATDQPFVLHGQNGILSGDNNTHAPPASTLEMDTDDGGGHYTLVEDHIDRVCVGEGSPGIPSYNWTGACHDGKQEILVELTEIWNEIFSSEGELQLYERFLLLCELPFTILRKITIPIPCEGYYNRGFVALSVAVSPFWFTYYLLVQHDIELWTNSRLPYFMTYLGVSILIGVLVLRFAPGGEGNMSLIAATPIAFYGFIMAATWIDFVADRLVSLLDFIGIVLHIPGSIMGLTVLAWGNSVGDLSANLTMARKGLANMAMTACFAGPVFNILLGLGLGFRSLESQTGNEESVVSLSAPIVSGFVFILLNCATILIVGLFIGKGRIEIWYGYVAVSLYAIYVITSITLEFKS